MNTNFTHKLGVGKSPFAPFRMAATSTKYSAPALDKGLDILEFLAQTAKPVSQAQVARAIGRTPSEIFRMLTILERRDFIEKSKRDGLLRLTPRMFELAHRQPRSRLLLNQALPFMHRLADEIQHSCHLVVRNATNALVIAQVDGPQMSGFVVRIGARWPMIQACSGNVLLAFQEEWLREEWLRECEVDANSDEGVQLRVMLEQIRSRGYARVASSVVRGVTDLGAPVLDHMGSAIASLTVPFLRPIDSSGTVASALSAIQEAAGEISAALGGSGLETA
jgi:DNA-binding IclR family transcriptional regulator